MGVSPAEPRGGRSGKEGLGEAFGGLGPSLQVLGPPSQSWGCSSPSTQKDARWGSLGPSHPLFSFLKPISHLNYSDFTLSNLMALRPQVKACRGFPWPLGKVQNPDRAPCLQNGLPPSRLSLSFLQAGPLGALAPSPSSAHSSCLASFSLPFRPQLPLQGGPP